MPCIVMIFKVLQRGQACTTTHNWAEKHPAQTLVLMLEKLEQICKHLNEIILR